MLTQERLKELFIYNPDTGQFFRRQRRSNQLPGLVVGGKNDAGYLRITVDYVLYRAHRLAFLYMTGDMSQFVDHKNGDPSDNRWANLRVADHSQNKMNIPVRSTSTSGVTGVHWLERLQKWQARIHAYGKVIHLGVFASKDDAIAARKAAEVKYHGEYAYAAEQAAGIIPDALPEAAD